MNLGGAEPGPEAVLCEAAGELPGGLLHRGQGGAGPPGSTLRSTQSPRSSHTAAKETLTASYVVRKLF